MKIDMRTSAYKNRAMLCSECWTRGPKPYDREWRGWTQCGVKKDESFAAWCPKHKNGEAFLRRFARMVYRPKKVAGKVKR